MAWNFDVGHTSEDAPRVATIAITIIASFNLRETFDYRISRVMETIADTIIDHLGGTSAVAKLLFAPVSTVHSWRRNGIPPARLAHLRLAARDVGCELPHELVAVPNHEASNTAPQQEAPTGQTGESSGEVPA